MRKPLALALVLFAGGGCLVQDVSLEGKSCSTNHPCAEGYQCVSGTCYLPEDVPAADAGASCHDGGALDGGC